MVSSFAGFQGTMFGKKRDIFIPVWYGFFDGATACFLKRFRLQTFDGQGNETAHTFGLVLIEKTKFRLGKLSDDRAGQQVSEALVAADAVSYPSWTGSFGQGKIHTFSFLYVVLKQGSEQEVLPFKNGAKGFILKPLFALAGA